MPNLIWTGTPQGLTKYLRWRRSVPFTDAQIIGAWRTALDAMPEPLRTEQRPITDACVAFLKETGVLTVKGVNFALGYLLPTCALCGAKALYRSGYEGRCSTHRLVHSVSERARILAIETRGNARATSADDWDRTLRRRVESRAYARTMKGRGIGQ